MSELDKHMRESQDFVDTHKKVFTPETMSKEQLAEVGHHLIDAYNDSWVGHFSAIDLSTMRELIERGIEQGNGGRDQ